ncbi:class I adenylate-forming enzyme family protein [Micromonospora sp. NPDC007271]|uniref:class I adenylate-forming enzyme family protein n=1 Tax=Micromonospora sp. NPDC007271 TaxID=3154587 RepID=UPI0033F6D684
MRTKGLRGRLAADPELGAGNVLARVLAHGADPDGPGLTFDTPVDGHPAEHPLTLGRLDERVAARAAWLHERGVKPRDPVAVWAGTAADMVLSFLALTRLGAIPALMNGKLRPEIAAEYIRRLRGAGVVADAVHAAALAGHDLDAPLLGQPAEAGTGDPAAAPAHYRHHPDDPIVITHTSGTTGVPKAVLHSHASLFAATRHLLSMPQAQGTSRILNALPAPHTATVLMVNQALGNRAEMFLLSEQDGERVLDAIQRWRPDGVFGFSVTWAELARFGLSAYDLDSVRLWFNTGDCSHEPHVRRLVRVGSRDVVTRDGVTRVPGSVFIDGLGSSEMGHSMFHITHTVDTNRYGRCVGRPYRFTRAAVLDLDGNELPPGQVGWLGIDSPSLFRGYWNDSVTTYRSRLRGWYLTGDLVYADADGRYHHLDRAVDSVEVGDGKRFFTALSEERILAACADVTDCTVVIVKENDPVDRPLRLDVPDATPRSGVVVTDVLLELAAGADPAEDRTERIRAALGPDVGATLRRVVPVRADDIPVTVTGKVRKVVLRERYLTESAS